MKLKFMICSLLLILLPSLSSGSPESTARGHVSNIHGTLGESFMDRYFALNGGWEKLPGEVGRNGIDGLYVVRDQNGVIKKVLIAESKFGNSPLGSACGKQQMTDAWINCTLDSLDKRREKLKQKVAGGKATKAEEKELEQLIKNKKDYDNIRIHVKKGDHYRRIVRVEVKSGELRMTFADAHEENGVIQEVTPDARSRIETTKEARAQVKRTRVISLKEPPKGGGDLKVYNEYFKDIESQLKAKGVPPDEAKGIVSELKDAYKQGIVDSTSGSGGQHKFLTKKYAAYLERRIASEKNLAIKASLISERRMLQLAESMEKIVAPEWFLKPLKSASRYSSEMTQSFGKLVKANAILSRGGRVLAQISASTNAGLGAGLLSFTFDAGTASYAYIRGETFLPEFKRELSDAAFKGGVIGSGTGVAVLLGATPVGWVVVGIGIGGYFITDLALKQWHHSQDKKYLTSEDLELFGITKKNTIPLNVENWHQDRSLQLEDWR